MSKIGAACLVFTGVICILLQEAVASPDAQRLYYDLLQEHNKLIRPVLYNTEILNVSLGVQFIQLIKVDEVNQVISTNVIVRHKWNAYKLRWIPEQYGNIKYIDVPSEAIWLPDIVLYNNADGNYQITAKSNARVFYDGNVTWDPPAIYKSYCMINVEYFPYDKQSCDMKFGSWTFDGLSVNLMPSRGYIQDNKKIEVGMDLSEYKQSIEWDVLEASAQRHTNFYACCREPYLDITFTLVIRRKTLFYTVNLISPCVAISFLTVFVFYLPSDSGEKVTLCISILLSLTVFFLLLAEIIPPTSLTIPLIGKYLLFTMIMVTMSIVVTIVILNIHFRSPSTHRMRPWIKSVFIDFLPKLLMIERPPQFSSTLRHKDGLLYHKVNQDQIELVQFVPQNRPHRPDVLPLEHKFDRFARRTDIRDIVSGVNYIADHIRESAHVKTITQDWKYVAMVLDRLFLWLFAAASVIGFGTIILDAPPLYETQEAIPRTCSYAVVPDSDEAWFCLFHVEEGD